MYPYYILFFFTIILGVCWERSDVKLKKTIEWLLIIIVWFFIGFKYNVGTDSGNYLLIYERVATTPGLVLKFPEVGYYLLNNASAYFDLGMQFVYFICGFIISFSTIRASNNFKINPCYFFALAFPFHIVMLSVSGIRQGVAESLFIYGFSFLFLGDKKRFALYVLCATTFHSSALFFFSLLSIGYKKRYMALSFIFMLPLLFMFGEDKYGHYLELSLFSQGILLRVGFLLSLSFFIFLFFKRMQNLLTLNELHRLMIMSILMPFVLFALGVFSTTLVDRVAYYFILMSSCLTLYSFNHNRHLLSVKYSINIVLLISFLGLLAFGIGGNNADNYEYNNFIIHLLSNV